ncbi:MAG: ATP-binding protein [Gammaproteobacteria bacterium]|nr:ATP-binding protein [Gammaproteobacteria bacterium]
MQLVNWFDADMCAALGAILYRLGDQVNTIKFTNLAPEIERILAKNGFLNHFGYVQIPDNWSTTIPYRRFDVKDDRAFAEYIANEFLPRSEIPKMSLMLRNKFQKNIFEIFSNAVIHSDTKLGIFSCGQYFPNRHALDFSIADLGVGIRQNIQNKIGLKLTAEEAINWATSDRNTTKRGQVPGGLGLKLLGEFIDVNGGCIQIVSEYGYWQRKKNQIETAQLVAPFPGTVVSIEINSNDPATYKLVAEITENIF